MTDPSSLADEAGHFTIAALDHRDALKVELDRVGAGSGGDDAAALTGFKRDILLGLGDRPSAVMLEPEFSLPILAADVPDGVGITCALEAQGYLADPTQGNRLMDGWSPRRVTEVGAHGAKLLVLYRHDRGQFTDAQEELVARVVAEAAEVGVPALIEPVPIDPVDADDRATVIIEAARRIGPLGGSDQHMVLKLPYPGEGRCAELDDACGDRPWALLSWGVTFDEFRAQLVEACAAGCSGFAVGRALWREAVDPKSRARFIAGDLTDRFDDLATIAASGRSWKERGR